MTDSAHTDAEHWAWEFAEKERRRKEAFDSAGYVRVYHFLHSVNNKAADQLEAWLEDGCPTDEERDWAEYLWGW